MSLDARNNRSGGYDRRVARNRSGLRAERIVAFVYRVTGHRILARRYRTPVGEIDLIAIRGDCVRFVEVKRRDSLISCEAATTPSLRSRVRRASQLWLAANTDYQQHRIGFDLAFVVPWRLPIILRDGL